MLHSLGLKLAESLRKLSSAPSVDDALVKGVLKDVSSALLEADVSSARADLARRRPGLICRGGAAAFIPTRASFYPP